LVVAGEVLPRTVVYLNVGDDDASEPWLLLGAKVFHGSPDNG
jgi:hypothetical protein